MKRRFLSALIVFCFCTPLVSLHAYSFNDREIVRLINGYRRSHGLKPLRENARLKQSSRLKVNEMVKLRYFGHTSPTGDPFYLNIQRARYPYGQVGEILARGCRNERQALNVWIESTPHRTTMLSPVFRDINCSNRASGPNDFYVTCHFGKSLR